MDSDRIAALEAAVARLQAELDTKLWTCPTCAFTFLAVHAKVDGSMSCPACAERRMLPVVEAVEKWSSERPNYFAAIAPEDLCAAAIDYRRNKQ